MSLKVQSKTAQAFHAFHTWSQEDIFDPDLFLN